MPDDIKDFSDDPKNGAEAREGEARENGENAREDHDHTDAPSVIALPAINDLETPADHDRIEIEGAQGPDSAPSSKDGGEGHAEPEHRRRVRGRRPVSRSGRPGEIPLVARPFPGPRQGDDSSSSDSRELPDVLPVIPLRDVVLFNFMILPLYISRESSVSAIETTVNGPHYVLALTQKNEGQDNPTRDDLYSVGTVVQVLRLLRMPDNHVKALVQGVARVRVRSLEESGGFMRATVEYLKDREVQHDTTVEAMLRLAREHSEKVFGMRGGSAPDFLKVLQNVDEPGRLADLIAANLRMRTDEAQELLEIADPLERLRQVITILQREEEVASVQMRIQSTTKEGIEKSQKDYFLREQLKAIRQELGDEDNEADEELEKLKEALAKAGLPEDVRKETDRQLRRLKLMHADSPEANILRTYLELVSELPWDKSSEDNLDMANALSILNEDHYGLEKIKDRIIEFLSVHKLNPKTHGSILCFVGPPGVGKTSLGKSIARALGRKFERLSLGGLHDEAEIRGHRRTYIGAMPGRIIQALRHAGTNNPVIVLDEIDKVGKDFRGDPQSALLEVLDPEQNSTFSDHYLNVPFDLSHVMFLCTANQLDTIPSALRDRMEIIRLPGYTMQEKEAIATRYLVQKRVEDNGLAMDEVEIDPGAIEGIILNYTREAGVRELERQIGAVCRKMARRKAEGQTPPFRVEAKDLQDLLGPAIFLDEEFDNTLLPGMAYGLAWTQAGGEVLTIETAVVKGKGRIQLTGSLGDVMKESAHAAISFLRSNAEEFGIKPDFDTEADIHIHVPDGATPKDGPSAGVTLTTALLSSLKDTPVFSDLCMTGEIDIKGRVLPVGGIKEKLLGAMARKLKRAIIPWQNQKDLVDIPADLRERLEIIPVRSYREIYAIAFGDTKKTRGTAKSSAKAASKTAAKTSSRSASKSTAKSASKPAAKTTKSTSKKSSGARKTTGATRSAG